MKSKKEAPDDAISATKAAVAEGIMPGGGLALLRCAGPVEEEEKLCEGDERTGVRILKRALEAPVRQIAENSAVDGGVVVAKMLEGKGNFGFDARHQATCRSGRGRHHRSNQGRTHSIGKPIRPALPRISTASLCGSPLRSGEPFRQPRRRND